MIFRRIKAHIEKENWFAVVVDFLIVVVGVFIGIQVANWNDARSDKSAFDQAMKRLEAELSYVYSVLEGYNTNYNARIKQVQAALDDLRNCRTTDEAVQRINTALNLTSSFSTPHFRRDALTQLVTQDRFRDLQAPKLRDDLTAMASDLEEEVGYFDDFYGMLDSVDYAHPYVSYSDLRPPELDSTFGAPVTQNFESRRLRLAVTPEIACKDPGFTERLYRWERAAQFTRFRTTRIIEQIPEYLTNAGLELQTVNDRGVVTDGADAKSEVSE